jgi:hypothetical protein
MMATSGAWAGEIYSQGMMMSTGDIYSQGMEITILGGTTNSQGTDTFANLGRTTNSTPPGQGCVGTAPNCTTNVTNTPTVLNPPINQSALSIGIVTTASAGAILEPASLALLAAALLWLGLVPQPRNRM